MSTHPLLELAVATSGGLGRWQKVRQVKVTVSSGGLAFNALSEQGNGRDSPEKILWEANMIAEIRVES